MDYIRRCQECGIDYRPDITYCTDCGGELVTCREEEDPRFEPPPHRSLPFDVPEAPPGEYRPLYFTYEVDQLRPLMEALNTRGIPYRVESTPLDPNRPKSPHQRHELAVREEERAAAREEMSQLPGTEMSLDQVEAPDRDFDPKRGYSRCPACSNSLSPGSQSCSECGLTLSTEEQPIACSECGEEVGPSADTCPSCGATFED